MSASALEILAREADRDFPRLLQIRRDTERRLEKRERLLASVPLSRDLAVIFAGSWGRGEVTSGSDNDYYMLAIDEGTTMSEEITRLVRATFVREEAEELGSIGFRDPGPEGTFGKRVVLPHLLDRIGREADSNPILTQRMLLVLESVGVHNPELHARARTAAINGYLELPIKPFQPPRLFLNDIVKYWRTICVDFAGKMRDRSGQGWGLRNAKLRTTRKMLYASGLLPLLRCSQQPESAIRDFLLDQFEMLPMDRVADAFSSLQSAEAGAEVFKEFEVFLEKIDDDDYRGNLDRLSSRAEAMESDEYPEAIEIGESIERGLLDLLFETDLSQVTKNYGIF